jgi:tetratricopeptide (TPR) repeat protein
MLVASNKLYEELSEKFPGDFELRFNFANSLKRLAELQTHIGMHGNAIENYSKADDVLTIGWNPDQESYSNAELDWARTLAENRRNKSVSLKHLSQVSAGDRKKLFESAIEILERITSTRHQSNSSQYNHNTHTLANAKREFATFLLDNELELERANKAASDAIRLLDNRIEIEENIVVEEVNFPDNNSGILHIRKDYCLSIVLLAKLSSDKKKKELFKELSKQLGLISHRVKQQFYDCLELRAAYAFCKTELAVWMKQNDKFAAADSTLKEAKEILATLSRANPQVPKYQEYFKRALRLESQIEAEARD